MAEIESNSAGSPAGNNESESGKFNEKEAVDPVKTKNGAEEEEDDEDIDALIEDLESQDGHEIDEEEDTSPGNARVIPEEMLQTDTRVGLTEQEVLNRRRKYGLNQMKEEQENL